MRIWAVGFAALAVSAFPFVAGGASADTVVYNGGSPDLRGTYHADSSFGFADYISFVLPPGVTSITDAEWWGGCYPSTVCGTSPSFTISVLSNTDSGPGAVIATYSVGGADQTATGRTITSSSAQ